MVIERLDAHHVACAKHGAAAAIPYGEGEVSEQPARAVLSPLLIGREHESSVTSQGDDSIEAQAVRDVVAIVQAAIEDDCGSVRPSIRTGYRLAGERHRPVGP